MIIIREELLLIYWADFVTYNCWDRVTYKIILPETVIIKVWHVGLVSQNANLLT